jgi:subtilisin family serine protease
MIRAVLGSVAVLVALAWPLFGQDHRPNDPLYRSRGAWGQAYDDQWGLKRAGFTPLGSGTSAWEIETGAGRPVIVAVIDTGLDYFHPDLRPENVWQNEKEQPNGKDDDGNGYVDDLIGWNFVGRDNNPWDQAGHGTHVAGIIAAAADNGEGIAGINRGVRIMPLKVLNFLGRGRSTGIAEAVYYAARHGARVINLSLGGPELSTVEGRAIEWAARQGAVIVVAAGNMGEDTAKHGPAGVRHVITVAATDPDDKRAGFSNRGQAVKLAAPGVEILSLRARRTDFQLVAGAKGYQPGAAFVGPEARYYRATGTSFAAPFVSGVASLLLARNPALTGVQIERMLLMSADDVDAPGWDVYTGAGRINAARALQADPDWVLLARVSGLQAARDAGRVVVQVRGTVQGSELSGYAIEIGQGPSPAAWKAVTAPQAQGVEDGVLGTIPAAEFTARGPWTVRVVARDRRGQAREARTTFNVQ